MRVAAFMDQPCINVVSSGLEPYGADMQVWTPALMSCPISRNTSRLHRGAGTMDEYRPCWMCGIHTPEHRSWAEHRSPSKSWFRHTATLLSRLPMNVNGMDCVCCGNWLSSIFCHQNACKLAHGGVRCKLMIQYRLMAQWDPAHLSDWFRWSFQRETPGLLSHLSHLQSNAKQGNLLGSGSLPN